MKSMSDLKKFFGQIMNTKILVIIFIVGIGLMMLPSGGTKEKKEVVEQQISGTAYKEEIEKQLKSILSSVKGAGNVEVMVTLEDDGQTIFAADEKSDSQIEGEAKQNTDEKTYVLKNDAGGGESPVVLKKSRPAVSGVLVIATGAKDAETKNELLNAVRAVLGGKAHRIEVLERK